MKQQRFIMKEWRQPDQSRVTNRSIRLKGREKQKTNFPTKEQVLQWTHLIVNSIMMFLLASALGLIVAVSAFLLCGLWGKLLTKVPLLGYNIDLGALRLTLTMIGINGFAFISMTSNEIKFMTGHVPLLWRSLSIMSLSYFISMVSLLTLYT